MALLSKVMGSDTQPGRNGLIVTNMYSRSRHDVQVFTEISPLSLAKVKRVTRADTILQTLKFC